MDYRPTKTQKNQNNNRISKSISFDEKNIHETYHPRNKDYGFMKITETKTPHPKRDLGLDASVLRNKLMSTIKTSESSTDKPKNHISITPTSTSRIVTTYDRRTGSTPLETFEEKRRKFYAFEYLIAKQHAMGDDV